MQEAGSLSGPQAVSLHTSLRASVPPSLPGALKVMLSRSPGRLQLAATRSSRLLASGLSPPAHMVPAARRPSHACPGLRGSHEDRSLCCQLSLPLLGTAAATLCCPVEAPRPLLALGTASPGHGGRQQGRAQRPFALSKPCPFPLCSQLTSVPRFNRKPVVSLIQQSTKMPSSSLSRRLWATCS